MESSKAELVTPQSLITEEHVKKALLADKGDGAQLVSWKVVDFTKKGDNYASVVTSIEVKYSVKDDIKSVTFIVKLNPCRGMVDFENFNEIVFSKEAQFYMKLLPELDSALKSIGLDPLRLAPCFHGSLESMKQQIYLADMRERGFRMFDKKKGMDKNHASLVLKELGRLHASSLLLEAKMGVPVESKHDFLLNEIFDSDMNLSMSGLFDMYITTAVEILKKAGGYERAIAWAESLKARAQGLLKTGMKSEKFEVVNHGDCWNNNIIFRYNEGKPEDVILLDLQISRKASLAVDLNYFFYTSMNGDVRKENFKSFLSIYYDSFRRVLEAGGQRMFFTEEELIKEFREKNEIGALFTMMVVPIILLESDDVPDMTGTSDEDDVQRIISEFRAKALEMVDKNPIMRPRFLETFEEFMECGLIP